MRWPFSFALESAGKSIPARMAMMAITTNSSIKVNPWCRQREGSVVCIIMELSLSLNLTGKCPPHQPGASSSHPPLFPHHPFLSAVLFNQPGLFFVR